MEQTVILVRRQQDGLSALSDIFKIKAEGNPENLLRKAVQEYLKTQEGRWDLESMEGRFDWRAAIVYIRQSFWHLYEIHYVEDWEEVSVKNRTVILVDDHERLNVPIEKEHEKQGGIWE